MEKLFALHKQLYDVRWNGAEGDSEQLEKTFLLLAETEEVELEKLNEMLNQLYIPPYKDKMLPEHLKPNHGGKREGAGRPSLGTTKKISITLTNDIWEKVDNEVDEMGSSKSALFRQIIESHYNGGVK